MTVVTCAMFLVESALIAYLHVGLMLRLTANVHVRTAISKHAFFRYQLSNV